MCGWMPWEMVRPEEVVDIHLFPAKGEFVIGILVLDMLRMKVRYIVVVLDTYHMQYSRFTEYEGYVFGACDSRVDEAKQTLYSHLH